MTLIGALTTQWFDIKLGRVGFSHETPVDWFLWGRLASFGPFVLLVMVGVPISALFVLRRVALAMSTRLRAFDETARRRANAVAHRLRLDEAAVLGSCALILSTLAIVSAVWYFAPLLATLLGGPLQIGTSEQLRLLSRDFVLDHNRYRQVFALVVLFSAAVWYPVRKLVKKGQKIHWGVVTAGIAATSFSVVLLHFPYRMMYYNDVFEAVSWDGRRCYIVGERSDQELLFCPDLQPPRNRIVRKSDPARVPLGITESLFKSLERAKAPSS
jgi:hypothetical protein